MTSRSRRARRRARSRTPAIWRGALHSAAETERPSVAHGVRGGFRGTWRLVSGFLVLCMASLLFVFFSADAFYVHTVAVGGAETLSKEEIFALTDVANLHLFWVDPESVRENLVASSTIADARVRVTWPPNMVQIVVEERQPALLWEQSGTAVWIDLQGRVMRQRVDRSDLLRITADGVAGDVLGQEDQVHPDVVNGALQLRTLLTAVDTLRYSEDNGLGFRDARGWDAWLGTGTDMPDKILIYNALVEDLLSRGIQPNVISVADPDAAFYSVQWGPEG